MPRPTRVKIVEVGPRDGLQNEKTLLPTAVKIELIERLADTGLQAVEAASFVSPRWVPQMADSSEILRGIRKKAGVAYPVLTPNLKGFEAAVQAGGKEIAVFGAASEVFSEKNINCSIAESLRRFQPVIDAAHAHGIPVRGYVSCAVGCPYQGSVAPQQTASVARALYDMGCYEISLGDTTGVGNPVLIENLVEACTRHIPLDKLAGHYHDTYGMAVTNIFASLNLGMATFDCSIAGLGGCPYAAGASGNVATEDVVYMLHSLGIETAVDLDRLLAAGQFILKHLGRQPTSKAALALLARTSMP